MRAAMFDTCPKCGYQRLATDSGEAGICARCGLVFAKWAQRASGIASVSTRPPVRTDGSAATQGDEDATLAQRLWARLLEVPERTDPVLFWGRVALWAAFFAWGWYFILLDFRTNEIGASFLHRVNFLFHEAGHIIFMPFGTFMMTLGGSLNQLLMPAVIMVALLWKNRDAFGASFGLWWVGQNLMDLAPYINDANDLQLMLTGGVTGTDKPGIHDWENILLDLGMIQHERSIAAAADALGSLIVLLALAWGAYILYLQHCRLRERE
jgi:hypothetical protein